MTTPAGYDRYRLPDRYGDKGYRTVAGNSVTRHGAILSATQGITCPVCEQPFAQKELVAREPNATIHLGTCLADWTRRQIAGMLDAPLPDDGPAIRHVLDVFARWMRKEVEVAARHIANHPGVDHHAERSRILAMRILVAYLDPLAGRDAVVAAVQSGRLEAKERSE